MADVFCAFEHWPRRLRHALIWALLVIAIAPLLSHKPAQEPLRFEWIRIADAPPIADTTLATDASTLRPAS